MVCNRCIAAVKTILEEQGLATHKIQLGKVLLHSPLDETSRSALDRALQAQGFELIVDHRSQLIEQIKNRIVEQIHHRELKKKDQNWSNLISSGTAYEYKYLSRLFSSVEGITIEQYIIRQKVEKAKELIVYDQLTLSEIAYELGYSSVGHLSSQFKKVTGMAPSAFREIGAAKRNPIDRV